MAELCGSGGGGGFEGDSRKLYSDRRVLKTWLFPALEIHRFIIPSSVWPVLGDTRFLTSPP
ncbi:uncharacterized protein TrAtP1_001161 [Trichoderma atroviride]|uniref:uncharacterized protein n=1 Tax=Hypocrea atroviridis TaxID=63577 RepID=UPI0033256984|nr:hypothetical protein TrAtP1_001161 [Trichoderma atroviride]